MAGRPGAAALRSEITRIIEDCGAELPRDFDDHTSLIRSGLLDSTALFQLVLWVEEQVGPDLDLAAFDLAAEWDTVAKLLAFTERHRRKPA
jgi:acyl carrier protein